MPNRNIAQAINITCQNGQITVSRCHVQNIRYNRWSNFGSHFQIFWYQQWCSSKFSSFLFIWKNWIRRNPRAPFLGRGSFPIGGRVAQLKKLLRLWWLMTFESTWLNIITCLLGNAQFLLVVKTFHYTLLKCSVSASSHDMLY